MDGEDTYDKVHELHGAYGDRGVRKGTLWSGTDVVFFRLVRRE